ncbi:hemerythrin domain-containing protein [Kitasatospora cineracea]|uniref:P-type ATPase n=1 Tax=Kitasatospora cineracea TaxID=88074 RepID=UPI0033EEAED6
MEPALLVATAAALAAGGIAWLAGSRTAADLCWAAGTVLAVVPAVARVVAALRKGRAGVDLIAVLALVGTLAVGEYLAGALIALMLATGRTLDAAAERRASHDLRALLEHAPRSARRRTGRDVVAVPLADVAVGDVLVVDPGDVVPVDGRISDGTAVLDESVLTGESDQVERAVGDPVRSGVVNAGGVFETTATATAENSTYAEIVRLAEQAGAQRAPTVRLAERYAAWFLPLSLALAGLLTTEHGPRALAAVRQVDRLLTDLLLPHEHAEEHRLYPALTRRLGGSEATETMSRAHTEIDRLARRITTHLHLADEEGRLRPDRTDDLTACPYGLHAVLRLHFQQEEESYFSLTP